MKKLMLLVFVMLQVCCGEVKKKDANLIEVVISSHKLFDGPLSKLFKLSREIKLSTKGRSIIESIDKIEVYKDMVIVLNRFGHSPGIFIFDGSGGFLTKLSGVEMNDAQLYDFFVDRANKTIEVLIADKILKYDIQTFNYISGRRINYPATRFTKKNKFYYFVNGVGAAVLTIERGKNDFSYFPKHPAHGSKPFNSFITNNDSLYYFANYKNSVYILNTFDVSPKYNIKFDDKTLDEEQLDRISDFRKPTKNPFYDSRILKEFFFPVGDFLYFSYLYRGREFVILYDTNTEKYIEINPGRVKNDVTHEMYFPFIVNKTDDNKLISIKNLEIENEQSIDADFAVYILSISQQAFN